VMFILMVSSYMHSAWKGGGGGDGFFQSMDLKGVKPNNVIYDMMIYGHGREKETHALRLITEM
jgi:hypothetical protein